MADQNGTTGQAKLVQYLTEAYGKEKELETSLTAHIGMATRAPYKKRLQEHLKETKQHSRLVERRLKKLGGAGVTGKANELLSRGVATAKGPLHALRGSGEAEKQLKNAKTEYSEEHEEIAMYLAIEILAIELGDTETAKLAKGIRREEERMASFLEKQIPVLTKEVVKSEVPASERPKPARRRSSSRSSSSRSASTRSASSRSRSSTGSKASTTRRSGSTTRKSGSSRGGSRSTSTKSTTRKRTTAKKS
jgi:ferritin-like metal-binding protein YciE